MEIRFNFFQTTTKRPCGRIGFSYHSLGLADWNRIVQGIVPIRYRHSFEFVVLPRGQG